MRGLPAILDGRRAGLVARLVANGVAQALGTLATALLVRLTFDRLIAAPAPAPAELLPALASGLAAAAGILAWLRIRERVDAERLGQDYIVCVRLALFDRLCAMDPRTLQRRSRGGVLLRFVGDLTALRQWVSMGVARLLVAGMATTLAVTALVFVDPVFAAVIGGVLAAGTAASLALGRQMRAAVREARRRRTSLAANVSEKIASMAVVQVFGQVPRERRRIDRQSARLSAAMVRRARANGRLRAVVDGTAAAATAALLLVGAGEVGAGRATAGSVVAGLVIVGLLVPRLREMGRVYEFWQSATVSAEKIASFLDHRAPLADAPGAPELEARAGRLAFDGVELTGSIVGLSAVAEAGTTVAIVGPNGAGKSSLLSLAARLTDPDRGRVTIDSQDLRDCDPRSIRRIVGMVSPDLPLLRGTIEKNLRYRWRDAPAEEIARVSALCGVDALAAELPDGLRSRVAEGGANLSVGQRQCIALARALVGNPEILLLDEVEANLDPQAQAVVDRVLAAYDGTVLMVTHRPDRLRRADRIWHLAAGRLVEAGPPETLLQSGGPTARLFGQPWALAS